MTKLFEDSSKFPIAAPKSLHKALNEMLIKERLSADFKIVDESTFEGSPFMNVEAVNLGEDVKVCRITVPRMCANDEHLALQVKLQAEAVRRHVEMFGRPTRIVGKGKAKKMIFTESLDIA